MFLVVIAPSGKKWGNVRFPMFPGIFTRKRPMVTNANQELFLYDRIVTELYWIYDYRSVNISALGSLLYLSQHIFINYIYFW